MHAKRLRFEESILFSHLSDTWPVTMPPRWSKSRFSASYHAGLKEYQPSTWRTHPAPPSSDRSQHHSDTPVYPSASGLHSQPSPWNPSYSIPVRTPPQSHPWDTCTAPEDHRPNPASQPEQSEENMDVNLWLIEAILRAEDTPALPVSRLERHPALFPFDIKLSRSELLDSKHFELSRQGLNRQIITLVSMSS